MTPRELMNAFEDLSLEPALFNHLGHLRMAWCYLHELGTEQGCTEFDLALRRYAAHLGATEKYHATVTGALLALLADAMAQTPAADFDAFAAEHPEFREAKVLLARHYSPERLEGAEAKATFIAADRLPLPAP
ncbi:MAG: hypothetical protein HYV16_09985 [Gammaproteobacteria bacterium]|nr:hypothetical protein [Gammaproteobacteria bacterium]